MNNYYGFCDLCINADVNNIKTVREVLQKLFELGYSTVAINQTISESVFDNDKKGKKKTGENVAAAAGCTVPNPANLEELVSEFSGKLRILSRLTFIFSDPTRTHTLNQSANLRKYDLYAVMPRTQLAFQFACSQLSVDIITLNKSFSGLKLSRKLYLQAVERGIHFEIQYRDVVDISTRKFALHYAHLFHMFGKSKNIVVNSGASVPSHIRNPYDIVNLATILGLSETKAKASILSQSRYLILKAEGRRYGKAVFQIKLSDSKEKVVEMESEGNDSDDCTEAKKIKL